MRPIFPNYSYDGSAYNYGGNFNVSAQSGNVNNISVVGSQSGTNPSLSASGVDNNVSINYVAKGTGIHNFIGAISSSSTISASGGVVAVVGSFSINTAGFTLRVKSGANSKIGTAVMVGGTVAVANTSITAGSRILITVSTSSGVPGFLSVVKNIGVGFTVNSSNVADTSTVDYFIVESF